jgi:hypothetical protein
VIDAELIILGKALCNVYIHTLCSALYVCVYVCMYICMFACMYVMYVMCVGSVCNVHVCLCICMYVCMHVCMYTGMRIHASTKALTYMHRYSFIYVRITFFIKHKNKISLL